MKYAIIFLLVVLIISCSSHIPTNNSTNSRYPYISLVFDKGDANIYKFVFPILNKYKIQATVGIVTQDLNRTGFLNESQLIELKSDYNWEIASESVSGLNEEQFYDEQFVMELRNSKILLNDLNLSVRTFIVPYGSISIRQIPIAMQYYQNIVLEDSTNLNVSPLLRYELWSYKIDANTTLKQINDRIRLAIENNEKIVILHFGKITDNPIVGTDMTPAHFEEIIKNIINYKLPINPLYINIGLILKGNEYEK